MDHPGDPSKKDRLRERIAALESDRASLMSAIRHMRKGLLDVSRLTDSVRKRLADAPSYGVLLDQIETEIRHRRAQLKDQQIVSEAAAGPGLTWQEFKSRWQEIDRRVVAGEYTPEEAVATARACGVIAPQRMIHLPHEVRDVMAFAPKRWFAIAPWLMVSFAGDSAPLIYEPYIPPDWL